MRLALLIGCRPKQGLESSFVSLREGSWRVCYENVKDSLFHLVVRSQEVNLEHDIQEGFQIEGPADIKVIIVKAGTESFINVWAEQI